MPDDGFEILAAKVLAGEATAEEQRRLQTLLADKPSLRQQFAELGLARKVLRELTPLTQAVHQSDVPIPEERLRALQEIVRAQSSLQRPTKPWTPSLTQALWQWSRRLFRPAVAAAAVLACLGALYVLSHRAPVPPSITTSPLGYLLAEQGQAQLLRSGRVIEVAEAAALHPDDTLKLPAGGRAQVLLQESLYEIRGPRSIRAKDVAKNQAGVLVRARGGAGPLADATRSALFAAPGQLRTLGLLITTRQAANIPCYSPAGATRSLTPLLVWRNEANQTYDVTITDELNPAAAPWVLARATSPIDFAKIPTWNGRPLTKAGLYRLRLSQTGNRLATTEITFRTLADATAQMDIRALAPVDKLEHAWQALASDQPCLGDALADLLTLPQPLRTGELALKLQLVAFGQLGAKDDYDATVARLTSAVFR
jgi:hypothetical protein